MLLQHLLEIPPRMAGGMLCHRLKGAIQVLLGTRLLMLFIEACSFDRKNKKRLSSAQMQLLLILDTFFGPIYGKCQQIAVLFRCANSVRYGSRLSN
jgi:hypothetical protein